VDGGYDSPCPLTGRVTHNNVGVQGVTVKVTGAGATTTTTDADGDFTLNAPLGQEILLSTTGDDGVASYGQVEARTFTDNDVGQSLELSLSDDDEVETPLAALNDTQDADKGVVLVVISGAGLSGGEGAMISATSDQPIVFAQGSYQRSNTIMTTGANALFFYNVVAGMTTITPINGAATTCQRKSSISSFLVQAHAVTLIEIECN
jgi:hypothetical protein